MKIIIGADIVPYTSNTDAFVRGDGVSLVGEALLHRLAQADFRVCNLEVPLTDSHAPIGKCGPALIAGRNTAAGLKALGVDLVTLANNHIMDQGVSGLRDTWDTLSRQGIAYLGAGETLAQAQQPYILEREGLRVGIYACAEHEFSIAGETTPGANPFDPLYSLDHIRQLKDCCDYVIVLYHGGREEYRYPSPELRRVCRRIAEKGADLIVCQHSHCIGCGEAWAGAEILYGQGNFLFTMAENDMWNTGLLLELELTSAGSSLKRIPLKRQGIGIALAQGHDAAAIEADFQARCRQIREPGFVERAYAKEADSAIWGYYHRSMGTPFYALYRGLNLLCGGKLRRRGYKKTDTLALLNLLKCEAHREVYIQALEDTLALSDGTKE